MPQPVAPATRQTRSQTRQQAASSGDAALANVQRPPAQAFAPEARSAVVNEARSTVAEAEANVPRELDFEVGVDMLSDLSDVQPASTWSRRSTTGKRSSIVKGSARQARAAAVDAQRSHASVLLERFSLQEAVDTPHGRPEDVQAIEPARSSSVLSGDCPRRVVSADNYDLIYHIPGGLRGKNLRELEDAAQKWGHSCTPSKALSNDKKGGYKEAGELVGTARIVVAWHTIGHPHEEPGVCADVRRNTASFNGACELLEKLDVVNSYVMSLLGTIDPDQYAELKKLHQWRLNRLASSRALSSLTGPQLFFEGREIQFNRYSKPHWDNQDPHWAWAIIIYFGTFGSCKLKFKQLRTEVVLRPGDVVAFRGQDLLHEADDWDFGERHLLVHFTHRSLWTQAELTCKSSHAPPVRD